MRIITKDGFKLTGVDDQMRNRITYSSRYGVIVNPYEKNVNMCALSVSPVEPFKLIIDTGYFVVDGVMIENTNIKNLDMSNGYAYGQYNVYFTYSSQNKDVIVEALTSSKGEIDTIANPEELAYTKIGIIQLNSQGITVLRDSTAGTNQSDVKVIDNMMDMLNPNLLVIASTLSAIGLHDVKVEKYDLFVEYTEQGSPNPSLKMSIPTGGSFFIYGKEFNVPPVAELGFMIPEYEQTLSLYLRIDVSRSGRVDSSFYFTQYRKYPDEYAKEFNDQYWEKDIQSGSWISYIGDVSSYRDSSGVWVSSYSPVQLRIFNQFQTNIEKRSGWARLGNGGSYTITTATKQIAMTPSLTLQDEDYPIFNDGTQVVARDFGALHVSLTGRGRGISNVATGYIVANVKQNRDGDIVDSYSTITSSVYNSLRNSIVVDYVFSDVQAGDTINFYFTSGGNSDFKLEVATAIVTAI